MKYEVVVHFTVHNVYLIEAEDEEKAEELGLLAAENGIEGHTVETDFDGIDVMESENENNGWTEEDLRKVCEE